MTRYLHENTDKRHRCPSCHCVMPWRYKPVRKWLRETQWKVELFLEFHLPRPLRWTHWVWAVLTNWDNRLPRRCRECGDVVAVPEWMARLVGMREG